MGTRRSPPFRRRGPGRRTWWPLACKGSRPRDSWFTLRPPIRVGDVPSSASDARSRCPRSYLCWFRLLPWRKPVGPMGSPAAPVLNAAPAAVDGTAIPRAATSVRTRGPGCNVIEAVARASASSALWLMEWGASAFRAAVLWPPPLRPLADGPAGSGCRQVRSGRAGPRLRPGRP